MHKVKIFPQAVENINPQILYALAIHEILNPQNLIPLQNTDYEYMQWDNASISIYSPPITVKPL